MDRLKALALLDECTGVDIWPVEYCRERGVPEEWIESLADAYESGYETPWHTIYFQDRPVNQFHGVHDLELAKKLGTFLGVDVPRITSMHLTRDAIVQAIREAAEED